MSAVDMPDIAPPETKYLPPYAVIVHNDPEHTFDYVILVFKKVFHYQKEKCVELAKEIDLQGRAIVWTGSKEVAELKRDLIQSAGADFFGSKPVKFPLGVTLEPVPI